MELTDNLLKKETHKLRHPINERIEKQVIELYSAVGVMLQRFTSGPLSRVFTVVPNLTNWEEILFLTKPEKWTPNAVFQATRLFTSNPNPKMTQKFFGLFLLPRIRNDIRENKRLHFMLFQSVKKALYKPAAFYKGIILPLCKSRTCTLHEAAIISSVLRRVSVPAVHSVTVLLSLMKLEYTGSNSFFIRAIIDKGYPLSSRVVDAVVDYFVSFHGESSGLSVVWYQALLAFVRKKGSQLHMLHAFFQIQVRDPCRRYCGS